MTAIERQALAAYKAMDRDIPDSDLDDEQPLAILVRTTLGEIRRIRRLGFVAAARRHGPKQNGPTVLLPDPASGDVKAG